MRTRVLFGSSIVSLFVALACNNHLDTGSDGDGHGSGGYSTGAGAGGQAARAGEPGSGDANAHGGNAPAQGEGGAAAGVPGSGDYDAAGAGGADVTPPVGVERSSRGGPVALSPDETLSLVVNRDVGSVTLLALDRSQPGAPPTRVVAEIATGPGSEPWQVVIAPDGDTAFVVLRKDQRLARIRYLKSTPVVDAVAAVGSEPTGVALDQSGERVFVSNWNDGTVSVIGASDMKLRRTIDLNPALVAVGSLGNISARPALAHPRSIAAGSDGAGKPVLYVTEYFGQQRDPEAADGSNADVRNVGLVYAVSLSDYSVSTISLGALADIGFKDANGIAAGCFPNQLQSITLNGSFAYVLSVCASPKGPLGVKATTTTC